MTLRNIFNSILDFDLALFFSEIWLLLLFAMPYFIFFVALPMIIYMTFRDAITTKSTPRMIGMFLVALMIFALDAFCIYSFLTDSSFVSYE